MFKNCLIFFFFFATSTLAINLECAFSDRNNFGYKCDATLRITSKEDRTISRLLAVHQPRKNDENVKFFDAIGKTIHFFPLGVNKIFPNLEIVQIYGSNLKEISSGDLQQFGEKLTVLWLPSNELEIISKNLFEFSVNLEWIDFSFNKIKHVDARSFEELKVLKSLAFDTNLCHSGNAMNDLAAVGELIIQIEGKCIELGHVREERTLFKDQITALQTINHDLTSNFSSVKILLDRSKIENEALKKENQVQSQEIHDTKLELIKQIRSKNSLEEENQNFKIEISQLKAQIDKIVNENNCGFLNEIIGDLKEAREERKSILAAVKVDSQDFRFGNQQKDESLRILRILKEENDEILSMLTTASAERFEMKQTCSSLSLQHFYKLQEIGESLKATSGGSARIVCRGRQ